MKGPSLATSPAPPMIRLARRLFGPHANGEAVGIALVITPFLLLGAWLSLGQPWTPLGAVLSLYYFAIPLDSLFAYGSRRNLRPERWKKAIRATLWLGLFVLVVPAFYQRTLIPDLTHGSTTLMGAIFSWALVDASLSRIFECGNCGEPKKFYRGQRNQWTCSSCGKPR